MDDLTTQQILTCKEYGKCKIYLVNQDLFQTTTPEELLALDEKIKERKEEWEALAAEAKELQARSKEAAGGLTNAELEAEIQSLRKEVAQMQETVKPYKAGGRKLVTPGELAKAEAGLKKVQMEWKRRRRACMEVVDAISESMDMNKKDFIKKVGLETDEDNKVVCPL